MLMTGGASIVQESLPHTVNVAIHVLFGTLALLLGLIPLMTQKGGRVHVRYGRWFLLCLIVVIATAVLGTVVFGFRAFLAVITMLAAYEGWSGYRVFSIRSTGPRFLDGLISLIALASVVLFLIYLHKVHLPWAPVVIYSTLGALVGVATYDLVRFALPRGWLAKSWLYEHLIKMIGAYTAVVSAFSGTVLERWQPYSQMAPSIAGTIAMIGFVAYHATGGRSGRYIPTGSASDSPGDSPLPARTLSRERSV
jgi:hypothetical protein